MQGWYAFDLDGTLAEYHGWAGATSIGAPVPKMIERVKQMLADRKYVKIFTARVWPIGTLEAQRPENTTRLNEAVAAFMAIQSWCEIHIGKALPITCIKDYSLITLYDDRCIQVEQNTGRLICYE
jgi:hypothetical protein